MLKSFRKVAILEGWSYILLIFLAMPIKYYLGNPIYVKYVGWAHGALFIAYVAFLPFLMINLKWSFVKTIIAFIASLLPFGTFVLDHYWLKPNIEK